MKRKILSALLWLSLCAALAPAAWAEEGEPFYDYPYQTYDPDTMRYGLERFVEGEGVVTVLPAEYNNIRIFQDGTAIVQKNTDTYGSTYGLVDYTGSFILPVEYSVLSRGSYDEADNILRARKRDEDFYRYLRPDGTPLTDYTFTECSDFCRHIGVGCRIIDGKAFYGAVNAQGEILIPFEYDRLSEPYPSYYSMEWLSAEKDGCYGAFDYNGNLLRRCIYPDNVLLLHSLSLPAQMTEEEELGHLIAASRSWEVAQYPNGYEPGLWGYSFQRDTAQGAETCWAIYPQFLSAHSFDETGHAQVTRSDGTVGTIDQSGRFTPAPLNDRFSDVLAGSWYDQGVSTCADKGIMVGTGEGRFSPTLELTDAECLTLALRLYDLQRGGDGTFQKAPEDYGYMTLTLSDGKTFYRYGEYTPFFSYHVPDGGGAGTVYVQAPGDTPEEREAYAKAHEGAATFMAEGRTWSGTVTAGTFGYYFGPCLLFSFDCPEAERPDLAELFSQKYLPAPDKWYRDAVYTAYQWGLDDADGFDRLVTRSVYQSSWTNRDVFARALATAAGELEKKYDVPSIPDLERSEYNESIYSLYESGILNGQDSFGTFWGDKELTRAECAVMVARVLDPAQRLTEPPATPNGYEQAVIDLRSKLGHHNEQRFDTDECTIFVYDRGGFMNAPTGAMTVIYKPGSQLGDGYVLDLPHVRAGMNLTPADTMVLDPEAGTFTYSYFHETAAYDSSIQSYDARVEPGTVTFTVDLSTGNIHREHRGIDYAGALAYVTRKRAGVYYVDQEVEQTLDSPDCTAVLTKSSYGEYDDYALTLVYKAGSPLGDGSIKRLILPSTVCSTDYSRYRPTDRAPDSLSLSEDGLSLRYTYYFTEVLTDGNNLLHEAGEYIYTADLTTGEVTAKIDPASQQDLAYHGLLGSLKTEEGYESAYSLSSHELPDGVELILRHKAAGGDPQKRDYEFYLVRRDAHPQLLRLPLPSTEALPDGSAPTTREPDSIRSNFYSYSEENAAPLITYTYRFPDQLWSGDTLLHDKGTYVYTVDVTTGKQSVELVDAYEKSLADAIQTGGTWRIDHQLETPLCTILVQHSEGGADDRGFYYPGANVTLIFKDGSPNGVGEVVHLPVLSGTLRYGSIPPHSVSLSEDKTVFTYVYQFDENQYAHTLSGLSYLNLKAGTYTYTVDLAAGTVEETVELKEE